MLRLGTSLVSGSGDSLGLVPFSPKAKQLETKSRSRHAGELYTGTSCQVPRSRCAVWVKLGSTFISCETAAISLK